MDEFLKEIENFTESFGKMRTGLNKKLEEMQHENPNLCAEVTNDLNRIFKLAQDGDLTALNEIKNKYQNADNFNQ